MEDKIVLSPYSFLCYIFVQWKVQESFILRFSHNYSKYLIWFIISETTYLKAVTWQSIWIAIIVLTQTTLLKSPRTGTPQLATPQAPRRAPRSSSPPRPASTGIWLTRSRRRPTFQTPPTLLLRLMSSSSSCYQSFSLLLRV